MRPNEYSKKLSDYNGDTNPVCRSCAPKENTAGAGFGVADRSEAAMYVTGRVGEGVPQGPTAPRWLRVRAAGPPGRGESAAEEEWTLSRSTTWCSGSGRWR